MPITIKQIEAAKPLFYKETNTFKPNKLSDGDGLFLIVTENSKAWRVRYKRKGVEKTLSLGKFPLVSLKDARAKVFELRQKLENGIDPAVERKKDRQQRRLVEIEQRQIGGAETHPLLFKAVAEDWLEDVRKNWKESTYNAEKKRVKKDLIGPLGNMQINEIKPPHMRELFKKLEQQGKFDTLKKTAENSIRIFDFAIALDKCENNPAYSIWKGLSFGKGAKNRSFPTITDPAKVGKMLLDIASYALGRCGVETATALKLAPYVFLRPGTLVQGEWKEIDWDKREWHLPGDKMKNGKPHIVPLARQVVDILKTLQGFTGAGRYMFPSWSKCGHLTSNALLKFFNNYGYKGKMCSHGLRHLAVTSLKELRFDHDVIYLQMSHTLERSQAKATYDKAQLISQRTEMMQKYADYLDGLRASALGGEEIKAA